MGPTKLGSKKKKQDDGDPNNHGKSHPNKPIERAPDFLDRLLESVNLAFQAIDRLSVHIERFLEFLDRLPEIANLAFQSLNLITLLFQFRLPLLNPLPRFL